VVPYAMFDVVTNFRKLGIRLRGYNMNGIVAKWIERLGKSHAYREAS
jgi:hypothetical protein